MEKRGDFLKRMELSDYKEVYDIKSEVPRTTILANTGIWKPDSYDIYTEIIKESGVQEITRDVIKDLYMRFNFGTGTQKQRFNYYRNERIKLLLKEFDIAKTTGRIFYEMREENELEYTFDEWIELSNAIEKIQGKSWGNLIFWWTSLIQIYTIFNVLQKTGTRIYNVYDGFYAPSNIKKDFIVNVIKGSAEYIYNKYIKDVTI
jgi:hypothetical protein